MVFVGKVLFVPHGMDQILADAEQVVLRIPVKIDSMKNKIK